MAMKAEGTPEAEARARIYMVDSKGLIVKNRPEGGLNEHKDKFAKEQAPVKTLEEVVDQVRPSVLIGKFDIFASSFFEELAGKPLVPLVFNEGKAIRSQ